MTAAVYRGSTPSLSVPHTQNTAPVLEFNCMYTHDVRRKQKRWQDGFLRFHTFNKRVMVYDIPRNFIGDTHWKADELLQDGDEVMLEKDGVLVQVAESVGRTETDLTGLRNSKTKSSSETRSSSPVRPVQTPASIAHGAASTPVNRLKHRSLNALLCTSKGPIGKASLPTRSPFDERQATTENDDWVDGRPPKRQRVEQSHAWNITRTTKTANFPTKRDMPLWARMADSAKQKKRPPLQNGQQTIATNEIIDLSEDVDDGSKVLPDFLDDVLPPLSSPKAQPLAHAQGRSEKQPVVRSSSPTFQTQRHPTANGARSEKPLDKGAKEGLPNLQQDIGNHGSAISAKKKPRERVRRSEPATEAPSTRESQRAFIAETRTLATITSTTTTESPSNKSGQTLRIAASAHKKKKLLCQDLLAKKPSRVHSENTENAIDALLDTAAQIDAPTNANLNNQRKQLQERLARIAKKGRGKEDNAVDNSPHNANSRPQQRGGTTNSAHTDRAADLLKTTAQTTLEQSALELAQLDQMIMPPQQPHSPEMPPQSREDRPLRRVVSESNKHPSMPKRVPGPPVRFTPSPAKKSPSATSPPVQGGHNASPMRPATALPPRSKGKKPMQRAVSLNTTSNGTSTVILSKPFQTPKPPGPKATEPEQAANPWSREAFDLFTWRPPGWNEENWCLQVDSEL